MNRQQERLAIVRALLARHTDEHRDMDESAALDIFVASARTLRARKAKTKKRGGSRPGRSSNLGRDHAAGHAQLVADYLSATPVFPPSTFRRRNRMPLQLFNRIVEAATAAGVYFRLRQDATGKWGLSPHQKVTAALRQLCYGLCADATDEYVRIGESTATESLKRLVRVIVDTFGEQYLRKPTAADVQRQVTINTARGFPGMFGSLDCTHWSWKNCPVAWQGMFQDRNGDRSVIMEAVATKNLWIWHCFAGVPGSNNDINVLDRSTLIVDWLEGAVSKHMFTVNDNQYDSSYLLCDGIYPSYAIFMKTISDPANPMEAEFAKRQESARKDVERCFGVLKGRFAILAQPGRMWDLPTMRTVWLACVILHNMIIESDEETGEEDDIDPVPVQRGGRTALTFDRLLSEMDFIQDTAKYARLRSDLIAHIWQEKQRNDLFNGF